MNITLSVILNTNNFFPVRLAYIRIKYPMIGFDTRRDVWNLTQISFVIYIPIFNISQTIYKRKIVIYVDVVML